MSVKQELVKGNRVTVFAFTSNGVAERLAKGAWSHVSRFGILLFSLLALDNFCTSSGQFT